MRLDEITRRGFLKGASAAAAATITPKLAQAKGNWKQISKSPNVYLDINSITQPTEDTVNFWIQLLQGEIDVQNRVINIRNRTIEMTKNRIYNNDGSQRYESDHSTGPRQIQPDSFDDMLLDGVLPYIKKQKK